jgi:hypothetical protein
MPSLLRLSIGTAGWFLTRKETVSRSNEYFDKIFYNIFRPRTQAFFGITSAGLPALVLIEVRLRFFFQKKVADDYRFYYNSSGFRIVSIAGSESDIEKRRDPMKPKSVHWKFGVLTQAFVAAICLIFPVPSFGHSPIFPGENHDPSHAFRITNPLKSWAIYTALDHPDKGDYYTFTVSKGNRIEIQLMTSESPARSGFLPSFALMIPGSDKKSDIPSYIEVPAGYGIVAVESKDPGKAAYEPFSPGWYYDIADFAVDAPVDGVYFVVVFERHQKTGNYGLPVGYIESFTPAEWLAIPVSVRTTYMWEGQNGFVTFLPLILVVVFGSITIWRVRRNKAPRGASKWLAAFAGLAFLGTTAGIVHQMIVALMVTGFSAEAVITLIFIILGLLPGVLTLLYALREKTSLSLGRRIALSAIGLFGLVVWAGFYIGPVLLFAAAVVPAESPA